MIYPWIHVNDRTADELRAIVPGVKVLEEGDCGSVWGEFHREGISCPYPHILLVDVDCHDAKKLREAGVVYVADNEEDWGESVTIHGEWLQDGLCDARTVFERDYRHPYGVADSAE